MAVRLRVKNFGPVGVGYEEEGGFIAFPRVTLFCGPQGSGKSTLTKMFSAFIWLEKCAYRDPDFVINKDIVEEAIRWQNVGDYLQTDTEIEYDGELLHISYIKGECKCEPKNDASHYLKPKISYMPSERNFASLAQSATGASGLPLPLIGMQAEFGEAKMRFKEGYALPANGFSFSYDEATKTSWINNGVNKTHLEQASSGLQSMLPMLMVSDYLSSTVRVDPSQLSLSALMSVIPKNSPELSGHLAYQNKVMGSDLNEGEKLSRLERYFSPGKCFINIVEEPEQNLYPEAQYATVKHLLKLCNLYKGNRLVMSTHSPFVVNTMVQVSMIDKLYRKIKTPEQDDLLIRLATKTSRDIAVSQNDMALYEIDQKGCVRKLAVEGGLFSDANKLNAFLEDWNDEFEELLDIEEAADGK